MRETNSADEDRFSSARSDEFATVSVVEAPRSCNPRSTSIGTVNEERRSHDSHGLLAPYVASVSNRRIVDASMNGSADADQVVDFLSSAGQGPAALLIEGEAGIGKTTVWLAAAEDARRAGFRVLSVRAGRAEDALSYAVIADLIDHVDSETLDRLPDIQRIALKRALFGHEEHRSGFDQRAVATAITTILNTLSAASPVLVAIDDVQWLDPASREVLAFAARRLKGRIGLLLTERTPISTSSWLTLHESDGIVRMRVAPMNLGRLQRMVTDRMGRALPRPTLVRIAQVSGGNPFYALELAQAIKDRVRPDASTLSPALAEILRLRMGHLDEQVRQVLLAIACVGDTTVDLLAVTTLMSVERTMQLLEGPENQGMVAILGNRVRFAHPLLAHGIYSQARPSHRRRIHRSLARLERQPELRARHMALAVAHTDPETLAALDTAADAVRAKGSPAAAAEYLELAIGLGGDTPLRRLKAAEAHFRSGDLVRSRTLIEPVLVVVPAGGLRSAARILVGGNLLVEGKLDEAVEVLRHSLRDAVEEPALLTRAHLCSALTQSIIGDVDLACHHAALAKVHAEDVEDPHLISQSLAMGVMLQCARGRAVDHSALQRAVELEDTTRDTPATFSARAVRAVVSAWTGRPGEARPQLAAVVERCHGRGNDTDVLWPQFHAAMTDIGLGRYADAEKTAEDVLIRAERLDSDWVRAATAIPRALAAAYTGREHDARSEIEAAISDSGMESRQLQAAWPRVALGFLEVSLGNHSAALKALQPLLSRWEAAVDSHVMCYYFLPDAVEALVAMNDLDQVGVLVDALEDSGARLGNPWMSAVGARCRCMLLAARGDPDAAAEAASRAMAEHESLGMPFERARTQLVFGQVQRRLRHRQVARAAFDEAAATFVELGTPWWAERASAELARTNVGRAQESILTPTERRVAELASAGMSNKDVAAALFISPKTVESNLGRVYRKLGVRTRVELARRLPAVAHRDLSRSANGVV